MKNVIITGENSRKIKEAVFKVLSKDEKTKDAAIFENDLNESDCLEKIRLLMEDSTLSVLVINSLGENSAVNAESLINIIPKNSLLVLNTDNDEVKKFKDKLVSVTFGFQEGADFRASEISQDKTNFKIDYKGSVVPVWLPDSSTDDDINSALAAAAVGSIAGLNLIEISQALKS